MIRCDTSVLTAALCLLACPAFAQGPRVTGPFAGLFGGGDAVNGQSLDFRSSAFLTAQRTEVPADLQPALLDPRYQGDTRMAVATANLAYAFSRSADQSSARFSTNAGLIDYSSSPGSPMYTLMSQAGVSTRLTRRISFNSSGQLNYGTAYNFTPFVGQVDPFSQSLGVNFDAAALRNINSGADMNLSAAISQRSSLSAGLFARRTFFLSESSQDFTSLGSTAGFRHRLFKKLNFRATYTRQQTFVGGDRSSLPTQSLDFGLDYGDGLNLRLSRRTNLSLAVSAGSARSLQGRTQVRLLGSAILTHSLGRSWSSSASVARTLGFVTGFLEPVLQDTAIARIGGQLSPRVGVTSSAALSRGYIGLDSRRSLTAYSAVAMMSFAVTRRIATFANYTYYVANVPSNASTLPLPSNLSRQSVSVGLSFWAPIFSKPRVRR